MDGSVKTSALALIPDESAWPAIQAVRLAHDRQVRVWPPHINILYPFVPESDFGEAARRLAASLGQTKSLHLRFCRKGHFGSVAFLIPECDEDPALLMLYEACKAAFPDLPETEHNFAPHLTIGQFANASECKEFLDSCPPLELDIDIKSLSLLARDSIQHPFRTVSRVHFGIGNEDATELVKSQPYAFRATRLAAKETDPLSPNEPCNFYQADNSCVRLVFKVDADTLHCDGKPSLHHGCRSRTTLFVVDQSSSMGRSYEQVKAAVRYMTEQASTGKHNLDYVLYNDQAKRASAEEVLSSGPCSRTSFEAAFKQITGYIEEQPEGSDLSIIFMTDGQDTTSKNLASAKVAFQEFLKSCGRHTTFHAIGFTQSHQQQFLRELCAMGTSEGMYRYADEKGGSLETRFAEMFDFADVNVKAKLRLGEVEFCCGGEDVGDELVRFDVVLQRSQLTEACLPCDGPCQVEVSGTSMLLEYAKPDPMFVIRCVDEAELTTQSDLDAAQGLLSGVQAQKAPKALRKEVADAKADAQARLDKYHELFARGVRSNLASAGGNLTAELTSLRHEATFSKARRARAMAQRATANASGVQLMEELLLALPPAPATDIAALEAQQLCCTLSGETAADVMRDSHRDFFVFALRVCRPEDVIDAPTLLDVQQVLSGVYSNEAFRAGSEHALQTAGPELAHGGFAGSVKNPIALGDGVGLFRGPDGSMMNACLPLFLNEAHFARVRVQIKPILGYFFTLDPLGYKGDQLIALFGILGKMLCIRAGTGDASAEASFSGSWADWLSQDLTKLCGGIRPIAMEYLSQGGYTGVVRGDLLQDFLSGSAGRTKERLPSLAVLIGWCAAVGATPSPQFYTAFVEELWRRNFTALFKGQPREPIMETLERLLYGPTCSEGSEEVHVSGTGLAPNDAAKDREFAMWGRYKRGDLSKKQSEEVRCKYGSTGPVIEGLLSLESEFIPRTPVRYEDAVEYFDRIVQTELERISYHNRFCSALYQGRPLGEGFTGKQKRLMLIQALQYVGNDTMNDAVAKGRYLNTFDCLADEMLVCGELHDRFENTRREKLAACVEKRNALLTAQRIVATSGLDAFAGRCAVSCPTRGGEAFNCLVALLAMGGKEVPHLNEKVSAVLTGKLGDDAVIAEGSSWVHCPAETARQFGMAIGEEEFARIELAMHGTWGHVYRESDIPNRHGHCTSNPNADLTMSFTGFQLVTSTGGSSALV